MDILRENKEDKSRKYLFFNKKNHAIVELLPKFWASIFSIV